MRRALACWTIAAAVFVPLLASGGPLPATGLDYAIVVRLDPATRGLSGHERIRWRNPSRSTAVDRVPLHLYLNAFANQASTWMRTGLGRADSIDQILRRFDDPWGFCEPRVIRQNGSELEWKPVSPDDGNPLDRSLVEVKLARPVAPGETLTLEIEFEARLPVPFARTGGFDHFFMIAQWFPKLAAFEPAGVRGAVRDRWNAHQFHGPTEFYADFADFDVEIGLPRGWQVAATGRGAVKGEEGDTVWRRFSQRAVHDFALAASDSMSDAVSSYTPKGRSTPLELHVFLPMGIEAEAPRWRRVAEASLDTLGSRVGAYPYDTLTVVLPPFCATETLGMEYPTLVTGLSGDPVWNVWPFSGLPLQEATIAHEIAHQYFYGLVATNEFEEAFLDEGFAQFWEDEIQRELHGDVIGHFLGRAIRESVLERVSSARPSDDLPPLRTRPSYLGHEYAWSRQFYGRTAATLRTLEYLYGRDTLDRIVRAYFARWAFRHPRLEDFLATARAAGGERAGTFLAEAFSESRVPDFRVEKLEVERWRPVPGRVVGDSGVVEPNDAREGERALVGLDPAAREADGRLTVEILDPGTESGDRWGRVRRVTAVPERLEPERGWQREPDEYDTSDVRIAGPGWKHLPVEVVFRFADGAGYREKWDGEALYRSYRFVRPAPLAEVRIDPHAQVTLDALPDNDGQLREADRTFTLDWAGWLGAAALFSAEALSQWL